MLPFLNANRNVHSVQKLCEGLVHRYLNVLTVRMLICESKLVFPTVYYNNATRSLKSTAAISNTPCVCVPFPFQAIPLSISASITSQ